MIFTFMSQLPKLQIDPRAESFLPKDSPALLYRDKVEDTFGLTDPMVIAVINESATGVFNPHTLQLVQTLTDAVSDVEGVDADRVVSLATEDNIRGDEYGMLVEPFFEEFPETQATADQIRANVMDFPLYMGSLVARDGSATLIVTEIPDESQAPAVYEALMNIADTAELNADESIHVAGDGAVSGYLVTYINADASRLVPISIVIITLLCIVSFRTLQGVLVPTLVIVAAATSALGSMAGMQDPIYVITTSLPILLVAIAVADSLHLMSEYYEDLANNPNEAKRHLVVRALTRMWRPITLTTVTSMIGFLGVYASSYMPPMQSFGLYAMIGLGVAGVYSLFVVPSAQMLMKAKPSRAFKPGSGHEGTDGFSKFMAVFGRAVLSHSRSVLVAGLIVFVAGIIGATRLNVNESWVDNFRKQEAIYQANEAINESMDGTSNLDIVIETPNPEDLFKPENLQKIESLQAFLETQPTVNGTTSIVDYVKQMNRSLNEDKLEEYRIPDDPELISQYFLLYSASGDPTDFEEEIDYDYRMALVRARLDDGRFQSFKPVVENTQAYIEEAFNSDLITASLSGRVYVDYEWLENLLGTHFRGVLLALSLVWVVSCVSFRSLYGGTLALIPVMLSTLAVYALMGLTGINLAVGTTMTAAIALGIGIDFAIHTLDRIKLLIKEEGLDPETALQMIYPSTGRALLFNFMAVFIGFGILGLSYVPPLSRLGILIAFAVLVSFVSSMTVLPALIKHLRPAFLGFQTENK
jgi:predicted RND superfamily exporter protein